MTRRKVVLLGAGSGYFENVMAEMAITPELAGINLMLYDIDQKRMDITLALGKRIIAQAKVDFTIQATRDRRRAVDGADYLIASIGVHGPNAKRHLIDQQTCEKFGIIHTTGDTVGPAGFSQGSRIIPIFMNIARAIEKHCPHAILLNHSNPMAPICRALTKYTRVNVIGFCHGIQGTLAYLADVLKIPHEELEANVAGPNHMNWILDIRHKGRDLYPRLKRVLRDRPPEPGHVFAHRLFGIFDLYPVNADRHIIEFFPEARHARKPSELKYGLETRIQLIKNDLLKREISHAPDERVLRAKGKKPIRLPEKPSPEAMGLVLKAMITGQDHIHLVNIPNRGAIPNLPDWAIVEVKAVIGSQGAAPIYAGELPPVAARWSAAHVYTHELLVDAAVQGDRKKALQTLICDHMIQTIDEAEQVLDALVKAQRPMLDMYAVKKARKKKRTQS